MNPNPTAVTEKRWGSFDEHQCACVVNSPAIAVGAESQQSLQEIISSLVCDAEDIEPERVELKELLHRFSDVKPNKDWMFYHIFIMNIRRF